MKELIKFFILSVFFLGTERLWHRATDGFALNNVYAPQGENSKWERLEFPNPSLLNQTYYYLNSGSQCYAFISEDQKTILKLFKFQHMRTPPLLNIFPSKGKLGKKRTKKREVLEKTFESYSIAYDFFRKESALLFIHLTKTDHLKQKLTIVDKIGKRHTLDLDKVEFILQKRGTLVYDTLADWMKKGEKEKAEKGIADLLNLVLNRCLCGIFDKDPDFKTNFGFIEETPFQIDVGRLTLSEKEKHREIYRSEMIRITRQFEEWIALNYPDLLGSFQRSLNEIIIK